MVRGVKAEIVRGGGGGGNLGGVTTASPMKILIVHRVDCLQQNFLLLFETIVLWLLFPFQVFEGLKPIYICVFILIPIVGMIMGILKIV